MAGSDIDLSYAEEHFDAVMVLWYQVLKVEKPPQEYCSEMSPHPANYQ